MAVAHKWSFFRAGGFDQVILKDGADLANLKTLDQKLWVALACPTVGLDLPARFLELLDADNDQRIRAPELLKAIDFAAASLKDLGDLIHGKEALPLAAINGETTEGARLLSAARQVLSNLGKPEADAIAVADLEDPTRIFSDTPFNGDGIITELSTSEDDVKAVINEIIDCFGAETDRSGKPGVDQAKAEAFFAEIEAAREWHRAATEDAANVLPLGDKTAEAAAAVEAVRAKVDDYFARCKLAGFDARAVPLLNRPETEYADLVTKDLSLTGEEAAHFPLAQIAAGRPLPLHGGVNPAHAASLKKLHDAVVAPLLGPRDSLTETQWEQIRERLAGHLTWLANKKGAAVEKLGLERLETLAKSEYKTTLLELIEKDKALESEAQSLQDVERLVWYYKDLYKLCTNFVNFRDFYDPNAEAVFQYGTLYLDQRACTLCLRVEDPAKHAVLAGLAGAYLAYLDCERKATSEKTQIVTVITDGDSDNLMLGRNGLFYDREGKDWDATITKIVDNPISLREAFFSPYKKFIRMIEEFVAKRASAADADTNAKMTAAAEGVATADQAKPAEPKKVDVGAVAAIGVAVAGIGTFFTAVMGYASGILQLGVLATLAAFIGLILLISLPSVVMAYVKLRKRNLGPLLDASGWAINAQAKVNVPFGTTLTETAKLPPGASRTVRDAYADKGLPWKRWVFLFLVLYLGYRWVTGSFDTYLPPQLSSTHLTKVFAPPPAEELAPAEPAPNP
jgi:hypothetical protein